MKRILNIIIVCILLLALGQSAMAISQFECPHDLVDVLENTEPTCNSVGIYRYRCQECGHEKSMITPTIPHVYEDVKVYEKPTCVSEGDAAVKCKLCGLPTRITKPVDPNAHDWYEVSKTPSTCTSSGKALYTCRLCGKSENRTLSKGKHSYGEWSVILEAGDFSMGKRSHRCKNCGYTATEEYYPEGTIYRDGDNDAEAVTKLQNQLTDLGYYTGKIDGEFGKQMLQSVQNFQTEAGAPVPADGIGWPKTIAMIEEAWDIKVNGVPEATVQPTAEPTPEPTAEPTPEPTPVVYEIEYPCCTRIAETGECVYCTEHQALIDVDSLLSASARDNASRIKALNQSGSLWKAELELLNEKWLAAAAEDEREVIAAAIEAFDNYLAAQVMLWKQQYKGNEAAALENANRMMKEQCAAVCEMAHVISAETVFTEKGFVSVRLVDGWYVGNSMAKDSITLHNSSAGAEDKTWVTITDAQNIAGMEQAKTIARFNFPDGEFTEVIVGGNSFQYIANGQKTMFAILAQASTGKTIKIDGRNCTLEQVLPLLQTLEIR